MKHFLKYFKYYNFFILGSQNIISNDKKILFNNSGFSSIKNIISKYKINLSMFQYCIRMQGIFNDNNINYDGIHQILFEMLCHFSFNSIFNNIKKILNLLYLLNLNYKYIYISINIRNYEILLLLLLLNINVKKIIITKKNIWKVNYKGYCGFSVEFFYKKNKKLLEIWNLVIINYLIKKKILKKISTFIIDTGMGLTRIRKIYKKKNNLINFKLFDVINCIYIIYNTVKMNNIYLNLFNKLIRIIFKISLKKKIKIFNIIYFFLKKKKYFYYNNNEKHFIYFLLKKEIFLIKNIQLIKINYNIKNFIFFFQTFGLPINYIYKKYIYYYK